MFLASVAAAPFQIYQQQQNPTCCDQDGDGFYRTGSGQALDCNDSPQGGYGINPNATEVCDGIDNNCNNQVDEGFDADGDGVKSCQGDCDDGNPYVHINHIEVCDDYIDITTVTLQSTVMIQTVGIALRA